MNATLTNLDESFTRSDSLTLDDFVIIGDISESDFDDGGGDDDDGVVIAISSSFEHPGRMWRHVF